MSKSPIAQPLQLARGPVIPNRIFKSAMSEGLGTVDNRMTPQLTRLYETWAGGGSGLLVTGNIMVDRRALGEPGNLVIEDERDLAELSEMARKGTANGTHLWAQLNHPGKQAMGTLNKEGVSPSAVPFEPKLRAFFPPTRALEEAEIEDLIERFGRSAAIVKKAGFTGVQIHGAHGYLVSQFLSGHHNQRTDAWGGSAEKRQRFVLEVYKEMRRQVGEDFPIGIKLNSADFQRGGFTHEESLNVIAALSAAGIDLIEISGGTYEKPVMMTRKVPNLKASTKAREAYFIEFAEQARAVVKTPLVVTGGFSTPEGMNAAIESGAVDMVGLGRLLCIEPDAPHRFLAGEQSRTKVKPIRTGIGLVDNAALMEIMWYGRQLRRLGNGQPPKPNESALISLGATMMEEGWGVFQKRLRA